MYVCSLLICNITVLKELTYMCRVEENRPQQDILSILCKGLFNITIQYKEHKEHYYLMLLMKRKAGAITSRSYVCPMWTN